MVNLIGRALAAGAKRVSSMEFLWNIHGSCLNPYRTEVSTRPSEEGRRYVVIGKGTKTRLDLVITTRCRKCTACRSARQSEWSYRVREETRSAPRTWFGTLTMSPERQYYMLSMARKEATDRCVDWSELDEEARFKRVAAIGLKEVTRYIKRFRKEAKAPFRYIVVTERHKTGNPHYHMLVHETALTPILHKTLAKQWTWGFEKWRLVPFDKPKKAEYLCKYISKDMSGRIRASGQYGRGAPGLVGPLVAATNHALRAKGL